MPTRRGFLAVTGTLVTAGCSTLGGFSTTPETTETDEKVLTKQVRSTDIPKSGYAAFEFTPETNDDVVISYDVTVDGDATVDVLGFEGSELDKYEGSEPRAQSSASYHPGLTVFDVTTDRNGYPVPPKRYGIVIDNTDYGTDATAEVTVWFTISVSQE